MNFDPTSIDLAWLLNGVSMGLWLAFLAQRRSRRKDYLTWKSHEDLFRQVLRERDEATKAAQTMAQELQKRDAAEAEAARKESGEGELEDEAEPEAPSND